MAPEGRSLLVAAPLVVWTFVGLVFFLFPELEKLLRIWLLWLPLFFLLLCLGSLVSLGTLIVGFVLRCWPAFIGAVAAPICVFAILAGLIWLGITADVARFAVTEPYLMLRVAHHPGNAGEPKLVGFNWGESGSAIGPNVMDYLVYDESDEIVIDDLMKRSIAWRRRAMGELPEWVIDGTGRVDKRLGRHFYLVRYAW